MLDFNTSFEVYFMLSGFSELTLCPTQLFGCNNSTYYLGNIYEQKGEGVGGGMFKFLTQFLIQDTDLQWQILALKSIYCNLEFTKIIKLQVLK